MDFFNETVSPRLKLDKESIPEIRFIYILKNNIGFHSLRQAACMFCETVSCHNIHRICSVRVATHDE